MELKTMGEIFIYRTEQSFSTKLFGQMMKNKVNKPESKSLPSGNGLAYTVLYLELRVEPAHMSNNGNLILRCTSVVATLYKHTAELSLGPRTSEPVPERECLKNFFEWLRESGTDIHTEIKRKPTRTGKPTSPYLSDEELQPHQQIVAKYITFYVYEKSGVDQNGSHD
ncbi:unnamed protein product [Nesidiocoris tenuis]|uniref:Uncharacterized protein n=1 Tax=Nesidiocoris tenuis TaxID=355587 RepID=A0A6H5HJR1_9HEMI|nr:unnamed protein product [Nesidiocoris tenuis]